MGEPKRVKLDLVPREWTPEEAIMMATLLEMIETNITMRETAKAMVSLGKTVTNYCSIEQYGLDGDGKVIITDPRCRYCGEYAKRKKGKWVISVCKDQQKHPGAYGYGSK